MNDNLDTLTELELTEIFAVEVAEWRRGDGKREYPFFWYSDRGVESLGSLPNFATDADALMPWLSRYHNECRNNAGGGWQITLVSGGPEFKTLGESHTQFITFARAACIALIRAKRATQQESAPKKQTPRRRSAGAGSGHK